MPRRAARWPANRSADVGTELADVGAGAPADISERTISHIAARARTDGPRYQRRSAVGRYGAQVRAGSTPYSRLALSGVSGGRAGTSVGVIIPLVAALNGASERVIVKRARLGTEVLAACGVAAAFARRGQPS